MALVNLPSALYIFHYPLICDLRLFQGTSAFVFYADLCVRLLIAFVMAWLAEGLLRKWINSATNSWLIPQPKNQNRLRSAG
jgi:hypothetical protein